MARHITRAVLAGCVLFVVHSAVPYAHTGARGQGVDMHRTNRC